MPLAVSRWRTFLLVGIFVCTECCHDVILDLCARSSNCVNDTRSFFSVNNLAFLKIINNSQQLILWHRPETTFSLLLGHRFPHFYISFWHNIWTYALIFNAAIIFVYHTLVFFWGDRTSKCQSLFNFVRYIMQTSLGHEGLMRSRVSSVFYCFGAMQIMYLLLFLLHLPKSPLTFSFQVAL